MIRLSIIRSIYDVLKLFACGSSDANRSPTRVPTLIDRDISLAVPSQHPCARKRSKAAVSSLHKCRLVARRAYRLVVCYLEATGSVTHKLPHFTHVKRYQAQRCTCITSSGCACYRRLLGAFLMADLRCSAAKYVAQLLLQSQPSLVALTMVDLSCSSLLFVAVFREHRKHRLNWLLTFSYRSNPPGCLWNEVWRLLSCGEANTDGQS